MDRLTRQRPPDIPRKHCQIDLHDLRSPKAMHQLHLLHPPSYSTLLYCPCYCTRGLTAPRLQLPKTVDPLWTVKRAKDPGPTPQNAPTPDVIAAIPLFKEHPETTAERIECSTELNPEQLSSIVVGPRSVDFGKTSTAMSAVQHFVVRNPLTTSIHVVMGSAKVPELSKSKPMAQVIPPGARWGGLSRFRVLIQGSGCLISGCAPVPESKHSNGSTAAFSATSMVVVARLLSPAYAPFPQCHLDQCWYALQARPPSSH